MKKPTAYYRVLYAIIGAGLLVLGLRIILVGQIGAGRVLQGEPATLLGFLLGLAGSYILLLAFRT